MSLLQAVLPYVAVAVLTVLIYTTVGWFAHEQNLSYWLGEFGVVTEATVIERRTEVSRGTNYFITYRFHPKGIKSLVYEREQFVSRGTYDMLHKESKVSIIYYPPKPMLSRLTGHFEDNLASDNARLAAILLMNVTPLWLIFAIMLYGERLYHELSIIAQLALSGTAVDAEIISCEDQRKRYFITYQFNAREYFTGKQEVSAQRYAALTEGSQVTIRYLPTNPGMCRLTGAYTDNTVWNRALWSMVFCFCAAVLVALLMGYLWIKFRPT